MGNSSCMTNKLFLHMGPGFHSQVEKLKFAKFYPDVMFWDQPKSKDFSSLCSAAEEIVEKLSEQDGQPISLRAHSFGAQIALHLLQSIPEKIASLVVLNSAYDPFECFLNLWEGSSIEKNEVRKLPTSEKMSFIFEVASRPDFASRYWHSNAKMQEYIQLADRFPKIDLAEFTKIFSSFLEVTRNRNFEKLKSRLSTWKNPVTIIECIDDQLIQNSNDLGKWPEMFPQAKTYRVSNSGHYALFEDESLGALFWGTL